MPNLNNLTTQDLQWGTANWSGQGYIDGLKMVWNSATSISVTSGAAYIPSLSKCLPSLSTLTLAGLSLSASTFYHIYFYSNAGVPTIECVATAPDTPYYGTARTKIGDPTKRYLGSVLTDTSGNVINFDHAIQENAVHYKSNINNNGLHPLSAGASKTQVNVSLSAVIPSSGNRAFLYLENSSNDIAYVGVPSLALVANVFTFVRPSSRLSSQYLMESQQISYLMGAAITSGGLDVYVQGYIYER